MPAAAVIPAPIAYTKIVAVKKLVVGFLARSDLSGRRLVALRCDWLCRFGIWSFCHHSWRVIRLLIELGYDPDQLL